MALPLTALLALPACGSTVQPDGLQPAGMGQPGAPADEAGLSLPQGGADPSAADALTPQSGPGSRGVADGPADESGPAAASAPSTGPAARVGGAAPAISGHGPGVQAKTLAVGFNYYGGADEYQAALGSSAQAGDLKAKAEAVVRDINATGGVAGRRLVVVYHKTDAQSAEPAAARAEAACAAFTQDAKVLVALRATPPINSGDNFVPCMQRAGGVTAGVEADLTVRDFARFHSYYDVLTLPTDKVAANLVDALVRQDYFSSWNTTSGSPGSAPVKVGILAPDSPGWEWTVPNVLLPELARAGIKVDPDNVVMWQFPQSKAEDGRAASQIQAAALKFRSNQVTHVLPVDINSAAFFASAAEGQGYRPRYGVTTRAAVQTNAGSLIPHTQLNGALGIGWVPLKDLPGSETASSKGPYAGPGQQHCLQVMAKAGMAFEQAYERMVALGICDLFYSAKAALDAVPDSSPINASTYMAALEGLRSGYKVATLPAAEFGPQRHYAATHAWSYRYDGGCRCMRYAGQPYRMR